MVVHIIERIAGSKGARTSRDRPTRRGIKTRNGQPDFYCAASDLTGKGHGGNEDGYRDPADPDGCDDNELKEILRAFIGTLIELLDPRYAEVVRRAEISGQTPSQIADELNLGEQEVASRLLTGRRTLLHLVMLTLHPPHQE